MCLPRVLKQKNKAFSCKGESGVKTEAKGKNRKVVVWMGLPLF